MAMALQLSLAQLLSRDLRLELPSGSGSVKVCLGKAGGETLRLETDSAQLQGDLSLAEVCYSPLAGGGHEVRTDRLGLFNVDATLGDVNLRCRELELSQPRVRFGGGKSLALECSRAVGREVELRTSAATLRLDEVTLPRGLRHGAEGTSVPCLEVGKLRAEVPDLAGLLKGNAGDSAPEPNTPAATRSLPNLPLLDQLEGQVDLNLTLDVRLPVLKSRVATHRFRIPIREGSLNFKQLEHCLSGLEDAVLDFEVTREGLLFELDIIPGIPFDNQTLLVWPMSGPELERAKKEKVVRLRRLLEYRLGDAIVKQQRKAAADKRPAASDESSARLSQLDIEGLDVELRLTGPSELELGRSGKLRLGHAEGTTGCDQLQLRGELHHSARGHVAPGELSLRAQRLDVGLEAELAGKKLRVQRAKVEACSVDPVTFAGFTPGRLAAKLEGVRLYDFVLAPGGD